MNPKLPIKISPHEMKDLSLKLNYNSATDFKEVLEFSFSGKSYTLYEQYCKNPECSCTDVSIDLVEIQNNKLTEKVLSFDYNYEKKIVFDAKSILPPNFENELEADDSFNLVLKFRNEKVKLTFVENELKATKEQMRYLISSKRVISRNDPCVCGRKYKNCCGK
jgi:hypothetical protein